MTASILRGVGTGRVADILELVLSIDQHPGSNSL